MSSLAGINKCHQRASSTVWWPNIGAQLTKKVKLCDFCAVHKPTQKFEPLLSTPLPCGPWQRIAADHKELPYYGGIFFKRHCNRSPHLYHEQKHHWQAEKHVREMGDFTRTGQRQCDSFLQWSSRTSNRGMVSYTLPSPHYPQASGAAERAVQKAKHIL